MDHYSHQSFIILVIVIEKQYNINIEFQMQSICHREIHVSRSFILIGKNSTTKCNNINIASHKLVLSTSIWWFYRTLQTHFAISKHVVFYVLPAGSSGDETDIS